MEHFRHVTALSRTVIDCGVGGRGSGRGLKMTAFARCRSCEIAKLADGETREPTVAAVSAARESVARGGGA